MKDNEIINKGELYTISLYHGKNNYDSTLEVVSNDSQYGELKMSKNKNSILRVDLELAYGSLYYYTWSVDWWLSGLEWIDKESHKKLFKYKIENLNKIKNEISKYKTIRIWIDKNDSNSYMFSLFFFGKFYNLIKTKKIIIVNLDNYYKDNKTLEELIVDNNLEETELSVEKLDKYKLEWEKQVEINSDIRDVRDGIIKNLSYEELYKPVLDVIKKLGRVNRMKAIFELQESNILNNGHPIIYNYIIKCLIDKGSLKEYKIDYSKNKDADSYVIDDEYRNNEIEYSNWRYCLVGNIVDRRLYGENHEIRYGTKNFSPGTKVYVSYPHWGDGGEYRVVIGLPKNRKKLIECIIRREFICNWRLKKIYPSSVLDKMDNSEYSWWGNDEETKEWILDSAKWLNEHAQEENKGLKNDDSISFIENIDKLNVDDELLNRISSEFNMNTADEIINCCKKIIKNKRCNISREGKNWCCKLENIKIMVNASNYNVVVLKYIKQS